MPVVAKAKTNKRIQARRSRGHAPLDQLIWYLGRAYYAYVGVLEQILADTGLDRHVRPGMGHILFTLFEEDDRSIKDIAARSQLACSTLTGMLVRMESAGLVERRRDSQDGRVVRIRLTPLGRSLEPGCQVVAAQLNGLFQNGMGDRAVRQSKRLLQQMIETMRNGASPRRRGSIIGTTHKE
jgi:DNA-binding MarR family transcriptional regulator